MTDLLNWAMRASPDLKSATGRFVSVEKAHFPAAANELFSVLGGAENDDLWTFIPLGPFEDADTFGAAMRYMNEQSGWRTQLFRDVATGGPLGMASYMRIRPEAGSAEVGCVVFSKTLQRTPAATEAMYLMAKHVFDDLGYRRYEWKCDNGNEASKRAALRLGFTFEGIFRQDLVVKGKNRDTAWYSMIDAEWPTVKTAFETWLSPENFDSDGRQRRTLAEIRGS